MKPEVTVYTLLLPVGLDLACQKVGVTKIAARLARRLVICPTSSQILQPPMLESVVFGKRHKNISVYACMLKDFVQTQMDSTVYPVISIFATMKGTMYCRLICKLMAISR